MDLCRGTPLSTDKKWLQLTAGLMWSMVGLALWSYASRWLKPLPLSSVLGYIFPGVLLASCIHFFGFSHLAKDNIKRIRNLPEDTPSLFRFQKWISYPVVGVMVCLGIYLRKYSSLPRPLLGLMYIGIGGGLLLSSIHYYIHLWKEHLDPSVESKDL